MLQSERIKSESYVKTEATHTLKCPHLQQQINFHMNSDWNFYFIYLFKFMLYPWIRGFIDHIVAASKLPGRFSPKCFKFS